MTDMGDPFAPLGDDEKASAGQRKDKAKGNGTFMPMSVMGDVEPPEKRHPKLGLAKVRYCYRNAAGHLEGFVYRDWSNKGVFTPKEPRPLRFGVLNGGELGSWHWRGWADDEARPLYRLPELLAAPELPVLVVEGEKTADAAARLLAGELVPTTSMNGAESPQKTDWTPVQSRAVVIWPDHDQEGLKYAGRVARLALAAGAASVRVVELPPGLPAKWDLADPLPDGCDLDRIRVLIAEAPAFVDTGEQEEAAGQPNGEAKPEKWPEPEELSEREEPQPYPLDALPHDVKAAVVEYQRYGMQPIELVVTCALAAMGSVVQGLVNVRREATLKGAVSLCTIIIAQSGERKTACDLAFGAAADRWTRAERKRIEPMRRGQLAVMDEWEATRQRLLGQIRGWSTKRAKPAKPTATVTGKDAAAGEKREGAAAPAAPAASAPELSLEDLRRQLKEHYRAKPSALPWPLPRFENHTIESIAKVLHETWPSVGWASNEGAAVVGGHSFKDETLQQTLAFLNARWDGAALDRGRSSEGFFVIDGRRLCVSLMLQPAVFEAFIAAGNGAARGLGVLSRILLCWPVSTMGTRLRDEDAAEPELPCLGAFLDRAEELYHKPLPMPFDMENYTPQTPGSVEQGGEFVDQLELHPTELPLSAAARRQWIRYANECERELAPEGEAVDVKDVAAKSAENACRLAGIFHTWQLAPEAEIGAEDMLRGITLARWYLYEARRVLGMAVEDAVAADAPLLARWVHACQAPPTLKDVLRLGPYRLRKKEVRDAAIELLIEKHWLKLEKRLEATVLVLNPSLRWEK